MSRTLQACSHAGPVSEEAPFFLACFPSHDHPSGGYRRPVPISRVADEMARTRGNNLADLRHRVANVTTLKDIGGLFDMGCFHDLPPVRQRACPAAIGPPDTS